MKRALDPIVVFCQAFAVIACVQTFTAVPVSAAALTPAVHGDFSYYTFALTWQPGICTTEQGCTSDQPEVEMIGLHGLWASLPQTLIDAGVVPQQWWQRGCDYLEHSDAAPVLDPAIAQQLAAVMPHFAHSLLTHEYDKHVACFHFDPNDFFRTELALREAVVASPFGHYLVQQTGRDIAHADIEAAFRSAFATSHGKSLQLQCEHDANGHTVLTQLWITIPAAQLAAFPQPNAFIDAPIAQDTCPASLRVPAWPDAQASR